MSPLRLPRLLKPEAKDPRHIVTPDAFEVAPELLGRPLATPWRRAEAAEKLVGDMFASGVGREQMQPIVDSSICRPR